MPDITMCEGKGCPIKNHCYRHIAKPSEFRQAYFEESPFDGERCKMFWSENSKMKTCKGCNETKSKSEFYKHNSNNDGLNGKCKECIKAYSKRVYDNAMNDPLLRRRMADKIRNYNQRVKQKRWKKQYF